MSDAQPLKGMSELVNEGIIIRGMNHEQVLDSIGKPIYIRKQNGGTLEFEIWHYTWSRVVFYYGYCVDYFKR